jgi:hypothetical protein
MNIRPVVAALSHLSLRRRTVHLPEPAAVHPIPSHEQMMLDLRVLRQRGVLRVRLLNLPALREAAGVASARPEADTAVQIEELLRVAVDRLGDEEIGMAARYLFGLIQGTIGRRPTDLRERAAREFGLSAETFRKHQERLLLSRIADEMITVCRAAADSGSQPRPVRLRLGRSP